MAFTPKSGTAGRVKNGSVTIAGISSWKLAKEVTPIPIQHFELTTDADGVTYVSHLKGLGKGTVTLEGIYDTDATLNTEIGTPLLGNGKDVILDLYYDKTNNLGYMNVTGFVQNFETTNVIDNKEVRFTCQVILTAAPPAPGTIS